MWPGVRSMSSVPTRDSPDKPDLRPSFRKPSNDSAHRKYRHHSPIDGSDSFSSGGSPRRQQSIIQVTSLENRNKVPENSARKHHGKESERDSGHCHSGRGTNSHRYPDNYQSSYQNNDELSGYHRHSNDEDVKSVRYSAGELRSNRSDRECKNSFERSKESRNADRYHTTDKFENSEHRSRGKDVEVNMSADHMYNEKESTRAASGSWKISSIRDNRWADEWKQPRERVDRDERRIYSRSLSDYKKVIAPTPEDSRGHAKDSFIGRESDRYRPKEIQRKEIDEHDYHARKRRYNERDTRKCEDKYSRDPVQNRKESASFPVFHVSEERSKSHVDKNSNAAEEPSFSSKNSKLGQSVTLNMAEGKSSLSAKQVKESTEKFTIGQDLNAAKLAAIQAAELVNRNLVGTGLMSTDQKKKLLWGSKKNIPDESGTRWDLQLFSDRERQEKFNKLMGVKGDGIPQERKPDEKDVEKQKELQLDLEKQYTAGLRRRDGRTVGLGL